MMNYAKGWSASWPPRQASLVSLLLRAEMRELTCPFSICTAQKQGVGVAGAQFNITFTEDARQKQAAATAAAGGTSGSIGGASTGAGAPFQFGQPAQANGAADAGAPFQFGQPAVASGGGSPNQVFHFGASPPAEQARGGKQAKR